MANVWLKAGGAAALGAASAAYVHGRVRQAEREHPALGRFVDVEGVRLHYVERGEGPPLVLLHGLGSMAEDFLLSGLVDEAARRHRVIVIDRPGYGHSERPRRWHYGPGAQARLVHAALQALDAHGPIVLGHSWGTLVAVELALRYPGAVRSLVLASGLYFPSLRLDAPLMIGPSIPLAGDLAAHTVSPLIGRAMWGTWTKAVFAPAPVSEAFHRFPTWLALRPSQLRAVAEEAAMTLPATLRLARRYRELALPVTLVAGRRDRYVKTRAHTARLARLLPEARLLLSERAGHMVHHSDPALVLRAIDEAASAASAR